MLKRRVLCENWTTKTIQELFVSEGAAFELFLSGNEMLGN
jgi:hypothetical protein